VFSVIDEYAPGFSKLVVGRDILTPLDLERIFGLTGKHSKNSENINFL
jgi:phytoene dehydrogenase-like protein